MKRTEQENIIVFVEYNSYNPQNPVMDLSRSRAWLEKGTRRQDYLKRFEHNLKDL